MRHDIMDETCLFHLHCGKWKKRRERKTFMSPTLKFRDLWSSYKCISHCCSVFCFVFKLRAMNFVRVANDERPQFNHVVKAS